jgi:nephrocystin-3
MKAERDELTKYVFPKLKTICEARDVTLVELELRWGITDEEVAEGKAMLICLDEIDRSRPYFIGILGERYGWIPDTIPSDMIERFPWLSEASDKSITEMEILYGALQPATTECRPYAYFYFRDPSYLERLPEGSVLSDFQAESPTNGEKLTDLKGRIRRSGYPLQENYQGPREFGEMVYNDLLALINELYPENEVPSDFEQEEQEQDAFARKLCDSYILQEDYHKTLNEFVDSTQAPLIIAGESGAGKSTLIANWTRDYQKSHPDVPVITHYVDSTTMSADYTFMLQRILRLMNQKLELGIDVPDQPKELRNAFVNALFMTKDKGKMILVFDSIEMLDNADASSELVWLPPKIPENVRIILSTVPGKLVDKLKMRRFGSLRLRPFSEEECRQLIPTFLAKYRKHMTDEQIQAILKAPKTMNPLFMKTLLQELRLYGDHDTLNDWLTHLIEAETVSSLFDKILSRFEKDYNRDRPNLVQDTFSLIQCSRYGLSENELMDLLGEKGTPLPPLFWSPLSIAANSFLVNQSGLLNIFHTFFQKALESRYFKNPEAKKKAYKKLADYWTDKELTPRKRMEYPWHLTQSGNYDKLASELTNMDFFHELYTHQKEDVMKYWNLVETKSKHRKEEDYLEVLQNPNQYPIENLINLSDFLKKTGNTQEAYDLYENLQKRCIEEENSSCLITIQNNKAEIVKSRGELKEALELYEATEKIARETGNTKELINSINYQAIILRNLGKWQETFDLYKKAEQLSIEHKDNKGLSDAINNQALVLEDWGKLKEAWELHKESEALSREMHDLIGLSISLNQQARILKTWDKIEEALTIYSETEKIAKELGDLFGLSQSLNNKALIYIQKEKLEEAWDMYKASEEICRKMDDQVQLSTLLVNQARLLEQWGRLEESWDLYKEAEVVCRKLEDPLKISVCLNNEAYILKEWGKLTKALELYKESEVIFRDLNYQKGIALSLTHQGTILKEQENYEEARTLLQSAMEIAKDKGYTQIEKMIQPHLEDLESY